MKMTGYIIITLAFLAASLVGVLEALEVNWVYYLPILVAGFVGVAIVRTGKKQEAESVDKVSANVATVHASLESVVTKVKQLNAERDKIDIHDLRQRLDDALVEDLDNFVEARESIGHKYGLQHYADVMSHFAAGERYLNRVWSCSVDGYIDEAHEYFDRAQEQFIEALDQLKKLEASRP